MDLGSVKPISPSREGARPLPSGNPLWAIPLSVLTATQERPIFSASRRPAQRAVVAPPVDQARVPPPQKAATPERLSLARTRHRVRTPLALAADPCPWANPQASCAIRMGYKREWPGVERDRSAGR